jgi:ComF family protein
MDVVKLSESILDILFPRNCVGCHLNGLVACAGCWEKWERPWVESWASDGQGGIETILSAGAYRNVFIQEVIQRWKFSGDRSAAQQLGEYLSQVIKSEQPSWLKSSSVLVPIPLHARKFRERGFNQTWDLACVLNDQLDLPLSPLLQRVKYTVPQKSLEEQEKSDNLQKAFQVDEGLTANVNRSTRVIILDDIATTGTTLREAAGVLRAAGFNSVSALVVARG